MKPRRIKKRIVPENCPFCHNDTEPELREFETLRRYMSERGKILAHTHTGICSKHQRAIAQQIKHGRHLGLLPFVE